MEVEADKAAQISQDASGAGSPVETGWFCSGAPGQISRASCLVNDLCFIIHKMHIKVNTLNMLTKANMTMLITSPHETPYPSPYMGYVGMWVNLGDGPKESVYKLRRGGVKDGKRKKKE